VQGLLGPNGAGKTTLVRILVTLLAPDTGQARISGVDAQRDPNTVRSLIGLAGQYAAVDEALTGRENLVMVGRLYRLGDGHLKLLPRSAGTAGCRRNNSRSLSFLRSWSSWAGITVAACWSAGRRNWA
jgi:ABC-type transport system involved in cytochrome c biogenesis ATPase subunit